MSQQQQQPPGGQRQPATQMQGSTDQRGATGRTFPTQSYLNQDVREATIQRLNQVLADTTDLQTQAKYAHWNVKGMNFFQLHELFDELAAVLVEHQDTVAERVTALGGQAQGTVRRAATNSRISELPAETTTGQEYVRALVDRLATHDGNLYEDIQAVDQYGDLDTADMLNEISREVTKYRWFLEAHLQDQQRASTQTMEQGLQTDSQF